MQFRRYIIPLAVTAGLALPATASAVDLPRGTISRAIPLPTVVQTADDNGQRDSRVDFPISYPVMDCSMPGFGEVKPWGCVPTHSDPQFCQHIFAPSPVSINVRLVGTDAWKAVTSSDQCVMGTGFDGTDNHIPPPTDSWSLWLSSGIGAQFHTIQDGLFEYTIYQDNVLAKQGWIQVTNSNPTGQSIHQYVNGKYNDDFFNRCYDADAKLYSHNHGDLYCYIADKSGRHITLLDSLPTPPTPPVVAPKPTPINQGVICRGHLVSKPRSCSIRAGRVKLSKLRWQSWGTTAKATGKVRFNGGKLRTARITLSQPKPTTYTRMTIKMAHSKTRYLALRSN